MVELSVIVPFLNGRKTLPKLVDALERQTLHREVFEIVFADDGSTDGSSAWLSERTQGLPVTLVRHAFSRGSYAARNLALGVAKGPNVAFTDADCEPTRLWLEHGLAALEHTPRVAGAVDLVVSPEARLAELLDASRFLRQDQYVAEGFGATANLFCRREVFEAVGEFRDDLQSGGDHEWGIRAASAGFSIVLSTTAVVRHPARDSLAAVFKKAERVGFGVGQQLRARGGSMHTLAERARNRLSLATGEALHQRGHDVGAARKLAVRAGHIAMAACTATGVARGLISVPKRRAQ